MFLKLAVSIIFVFQTTAALAGGVSENNNSGTRTSTTSSTGTVVPGGSANGASNAASSQRSDDQKGAAANSSMAGINFGMSAAFAAAFAASCSYGCDGGLMLSSILFAAMGSQNTSQSGAHRAAGGIAGNSFNDVTSTQCSAGSCSTGGGDEVGINDPTNTKATMDALKKLDKSGVKVDLKKGKITANGKTYDIDKIVTPSGFAEAGGTPEQYAKAMAANAAAEKKILEKLGGLSAVASDVTGGGAPVAATQEIIEDENGLGGGHRGAGKKQRERNPTSVAGLSRDYNGDRIGVAADNIFHMIKRRYESRDKQNNFITNDIFAAPKSLKK